MSTYDFDGRVVLAGAGRYYLPTSTLDASAHFLSHRF
jgi:hypothetical protein